MHENPSEPPDAQALAGDRLRGAGLRSTPQRRAILASFRGGASEHLSADEVYARAAASLPDLGRGTVYATLAEFAEVGLLAAFGSPEPVRYELSTGQHAHFRCRVCLRVHDVPAGPLDPAAFLERGHSVELLDLRGEGVCRECGEFETGGLAGAAEISATGASRRLSDRMPTVAELDSPLGALLVAATPAGVARIAFPEHGDAAFLRGCIDSTGDSTARDHLASASDQLERYFAGELRSFDCAIDWAVLTGADNLQATVDIPFASTRPYHRLGGQTTVTELGHDLGANALPIMAPCHRVTWGTRRPGCFPGGRERRDWLLEHEATVGAG